MLVAVLCSISNYVIESCNSADVPSLKATPMHLIRSLLLKEVPVPKRQASQNADILIQLRQIACQKKKQSEMSEPLIFAIPGIRLKLFGAHSCCRISYYPRVLEDSSSDRICARGPKYLSPREMPAANHAIYTVLAGAFELESRVSKNRNAYVPAPLRCLQRN